MSLLRAVGEAETHSMFTPMPETPGRTESYAQQ